MKPMSQQRIELKLAKRKRKLEQLENIANKKARRNKMVRAKFIVNEIARNKYGQEEQQSIRMTAVMDNSEENKKFFRWTPSGKVELNTVNPEAGNFFELGKEYYLDFTKAD